MPGITGRVELHTPARLDAMATALVEAPWLERRHLLPPPAATVPGPSFAALVLGRPGFCGAAERDGARLAVEGWVAETDATGDALASWLLARFLAHGEDFVADLGGSYQIVVHRRGTTWLYADPLASRRLFYVATDGGLAFSPEVPPLVPDLAGASLDLASLMHFMISGRFFAGRSPLARLRQLLPGEVLVHGPDATRRRRYFTYTVEGDDESFDVEAALTELEPLLERAVLRAYRRAPRPAFLLSGGWDSRFLFYTVARAVADPARLRTLIWGDHIDRPGSDVWVSGEIGRRFGTRHRVYRWGADALPERFDALFRAQSGMTEVAFTHVDELFHCVAARREEGIGSIFRGDEIFGPNGAEVTTVDEALARLAIHRAARVVDAGRWLGDGEEACAEHDAHVAELVAGAPRRPADLRDTLYARERLPALQHHLNYHKAHHVEMWNPLLDTDVVRFYRRVPAAYRLQKKLFKMAFRRRFGRELAAIPIATASNSVDWPRVLTGDPRLMDFLRRELEALPEPLERRTFLGYLEHLSEEAAPAKTAGDFRVPAVRLVIRAVVLGRWLRLYRGS